MYAGQSDAPIDLGSFAKAPLSALVGFFVFADHGTTFAEDLATLARFVADGRLRPHLGLVLPWERLAEIIEALGAASRHGEGGPDDIVGERLQQNARFVNRLCVNPTISGMRPSSARAFLRTLRKRSRQKAHCKGDKTIARTGKQQPRGEREARG
jgi:hypothetical protein